MYFSKCITLLTLYFNPISTSNSWTKQG